MKLMTRGRATYLGTLAAGIIVGVAAVSTVGTAMAGQAAPRPAVAAARVSTHHYALAASAFAPDHLGTTTNDYYNGWDSAALSDPLNARCFNAGLSLPANAKLKSIRVFYTEGNDHIYFELNRQNLLHHHSTMINHFDTPTTTGSTFYTSTTKNVPSADAMVNMSAYAYGMGVCPDGSSTFSGVIITYTTPG